MIDLDKKEVEYAKVLIESGDAVCPRCGSIGKLTLRTERKFLRTTAKLYCPNCGAFWEDMSSWRREIETMSIETLKREGLTEPYPFEVPIMLEKDEVPYLVWDVVDFYEGRKYTYNSQSIGVSLRVTKGVWLHPRIGEGSAESEDIMKLLDTGSLILTNKRIVFVGEKKAISTKLKDLISVEVGARIGKAGFLSIAKRGKQRIEAYQMSMPNLTKEFILIAHEKHKNENSHLIPRAREG